jgi:hypothetical protein
MSVPLSVSLSLLFSIPVGPALLATSIHSLLQFLISPQHLSVATVSPALLLIYISSSLQRQADQIVTLLLAALIHLVIGSANLGGKCIYFVYVVCMYLCTKININKYLLFCITLALLLDLLFYSIYNGGKCLEIFADLKLMYNNWLLIDNY